MKNNERNENSNQKKVMRASLVVQWLRLSAFTTRGPGSIPGQRTEIPQATWRSQKKKKRNEMNECGTAKRKRKEMK